MVEVPYNFLNYLNIIDTRMTFLKSLLFFLLLPRKERIKVSYLFKYSKLKKISVCLTIDFATWTYIFILDTFLHIDGGNFFINLMHVNLHTNIGKSFFFSIRKSLKYVYIKKIKIKY